MTAEVQTTNSKKMTIAGWIIGGLPAALLILMSPMSILQKPDVVENMKHYGYPEGCVMWIGIALLISCILYLVPKTSVLGAILMTGYFGGAVATHVRASESTWFIAVIFGILFWGGLWFREPRIRALIPLKS